MKSVIIFFAQSLNAEIETILKDSNIRGYSKWEDMTGRGSFTGEPHLGSHAWPAKNSALLCMVDDAKVKPLFNRLRALDERTSMQGLRAYSWSVEESL